MPSLLEPSAAPASFIPDENPEVPSSFIPEPDSSPEAGAPSSFKPLSPEDDLAFDPTVDLDKKIETHIATKYPGIDARVQEETDALPVAQAFQKSQADIKAYSDQKLAERNAKAEARGVPEYNRVPVQDANTYDEVYDIKQRGADKIRAEYEAAMEANRQRIHDEATKDDAELATLKKAKEIREKNREERIKAAVNAPEKPDPYAEAGARVYDARKKLEAKQITPEQFDAIFKDASTDAIMLDDALEGRRAGLKTGDKLKAVGRGIWHAVPGVIDFFRSGVELAKDVPEQVIDTAAGAAGGAEHAKSQAQTSAEWTLAGQSLENRYGGMMDSLLQQSGADGKRIRQFDKIARAVDAAQLAEKRPLATGAVAATSDVLQKPVTEALNFYTGENLEPENVSTAFSPEALKGVGAEQADTGKIERHAMAADPANKLLDFVPHVPGAKRVGGAINYAVGKAGSLAAKGAAKIIRPASIVAGLGVAGADGGITKGLIGPAVAYVTKPLISRIGRGFENYAQMGKSALKGEVSQSAKNLAEQRLAGDTGGRILDRAGAYGADLANQAAGMPYAMAVPNALLSGGDTDKFIELEAGSPAWAALHAFRTNRSEVARATADILHQAGAERLAARTDEHADTTRQNLESLSPEQQKVALGFMAAFEGAPVTSADGRTVNNHQINLVTPEQMAEMTGDREARGFFTDSNGVTSINIGAPQNRGVGLGEVIGHESGHMAQNFMRFATGEGGPLQAAVNKQLQKHGVINKDGTAGKELRDFIENYNANVAPEGRIDPNSKQAIDEFGANVIGGVFRKQGIADVVLPRTLAEKIANSITGMKAGMLGLTDEGKKGSFGRTERRAIDQAYEDVMRSVAGVGLREGFDAQTEQAQTRADQVPPEPSPEPTAPTAEPTATPEAHPDADIGMDKTDMRKVQAAWVAKDGEPQPVRANTKRGIQAKSLEDVINERVAEFNNVLPKYKRYLRRNGLTAPKGSQALMRAVEEFQAGLELDPARFAEPERVSKAYDDIAAARELGDAELLAQAEAELAAAEAEEAPQVRGASNRAAVAAPDPNAPLLATPRPVNAPQPEAPLLSGERPAPQPAKPQEAPLLAGKGAIKSELEQMQKQKRATAPKNKKESDKLESDIATATHEIVRNRLSEVAQQRGDDSLMQVRPGEPGEPDKFTGRLDPSIPEHAELMDLVGMRPEDKQHAQEATGFKYIDYRSAKQLAPKYRTGLLRRRDYAAGPREARTDTNATDQINKAVHFLTTKFNADGNIYHLGVSIDKLVGNLGKVMNAANKLKLNIGYKDINDPQIQQDIQAYFRNHEAGYVGRGDRPVKGATVDPNYQPTLIPKNRFDALNMAFNFDASTRSGKRGDEARALARENGYAVTESGDTNQLRDYLNRSGKFKVGKQEGHRDILEPIWENLTPEEILDIRDQPEGETKTVRDEGFTGDRGALLAGPEGRVALPNPKYAAASFLPSERGLLEPSNDPRKDEHGFYSKLEDTIQKKMGGRATPDQLKALIKGAGIKEEEIKWTGILPKIDELAQEHGGKIPKDAVIDYLRNDGAVKLEEETLGGEKSNMDALMDAAKKEGYEVEYDGQMDEYTFTDPEGDIVDFEDIPKSMQDAVRSFKNPEPKFSNYQLPGGENYREIVLTMLVKEPAMPGDLTAEYLGGGEWNVKNGAGQSMGKVHAKDEQSAIKEMWDMSPSKTLRQIKEAPSFTSSHFPDQGNYVAHMRLNDRVDADGAPGLFIEEIQSDRHQKGRDEGYLEDSPIPEYKPLTETEENRRIELIRKPSRMTDEEANELRALNRKKQMAESDWSRPKPSGIPDAPYRKDWSLAMFKRALRDAVEGGKSWIGWTSGKTQNERYDLSKQVDSIKVVKKGDDSFDIYARKDGVENPLIVQKGLTKSTLADTIGKDLAAKAVNQDQESVTYSGKDLQIGGRGMTGFYDTILPKEVGKYVKQWGANVEEGKLSRKARDGRVFQRGDGLWAVDEANGAQKYFRSKQEAEKFASEIENTPIWKISITPEMRASVEKGQPKFLPSERGLLEGESPRSDKEEWGVSIYPRTPQNKEFTKRLYHGTWQAGFDKFKPGTHFSPSKKYAERYMEPSASSMGASGLKEAKEKRTYAADVTFRNIFDTRNENASKIWSEEFLGQYGNGTPTSERGLPDWTDGVELQEFLEEHHPEFDGIVLDEGAEPVDGKVRLRPESYIPLKGAKIEMVDESKDRGLLEKPSSRKQKPEEPKEKKIIAVKQDEEKPLLAR